MAVTRIKNNQIFDQTITYQKIEPGTLIGTLFNPNLTLNSNIVLNGTLQIMGNTTTISSTNTFVNDPLVVFNNGYTGLPAYDIGLLINRNLNPVNTAWIWNESGQRFEGIFTTETGGTQGAIDNQGWTSLKVGNVDVVTTATIANFQVTQNTISSTNVNGDINVIPNGIGNVVVGGNELPNVDNTKDIGSPSKRWVNVFSKTLDMNGSTVGTDTGGNINILPNGGQTVIANLIITGSTSTFTGNIVSSNVQITGGNITNITNLSATTGNVTQATIDTLNSTTATVTNLLSGNVTFTGGTIDNVTITNSSISGSTGAFTSITDSGNLLASGSNAQVTFAPTGTGSVTINPATLGTINNMTVGGTTRAEGFFTNLTAGTSTFAAINNTPIGNAVPSTAAFTTLTANDQVTLSPTAGNVIVNPTNVGQVDNMVIGAVTPQAATFLTVTGGTSSFSAINNTPIGNAVASTGKFTTLEANAGITGTLMTNAQPNINSVGVLSSLAVTAETNTGSLVTGNVQATGGSVNGTTIGANVRADGSFLNVTGGTATFASINNTPIGNATPSTGAFTTLTANDLTTITSNAQSTLTNDGALVVSGGVGIAKNLNVGGNTIIAGNLTVSGTTTTVNSTEVAITDLNITVAKDATNNAEANGAGLTVAGAGATIIYDGNTNTWNLNKDLWTPNIAIQSTLQSNSAADGSFITAGGAGIAKDLWVGGVMHGSIDTGSSLVTMNNVDINGGTIDGTWIGNSVPVGATL